MFNSILSRLRRLLSRIVRTSAPQVHPFDITHEDYTWLSRFDDFTMTGHLRRFHLRNAVRYIESSNIQGGIVECGVWRGGSMMICADTLLELGCKSRDLFLYDTFDGMPPPKDEDRDQNGRTAKELLELENRDEASLIWAISSLEAVKKNMKMTAYPNDKLYYVQGKVEETVPGVLPEKIALLRLDTDWYESTLHELIHFYPRLSVGGVLIIDDYGHWGGCRKAVDEYFSNIPHAPLLHRIDETGRAAIKHHS